jgi:hypothetical protein
MTDRLDELLAAIGLGRGGAGGRPAASPLRFGSGESWRIEIPSVEGPAALRAVIEQSRALGVRIDRVSQGSGIALLTDAELGAMAVLGREAGVEVVLWAGARASWDISAMARSSSGASAAASARGAAAVVAALEEALRAADAGIDGVLMSDVGVLSALGRAKEAGKLPPSFVLKTSIALPTLNPAAARVYESMGATSLNLPTDLPIADIADIRAAVGIPLDIYIEGADDFAAPLRYHEIGDIVAVASPVHLKFGLRNVAGVYPAGGHLAAIVDAASRERVRRAAIGVETLARRGEHRSAGGSLEAAGSVLGAPVAGAPVDGTRGEGS